MWKKRLHNHVLFLDIETVPQHLSFFDLTDREQHLFEQKTRYQRPEGSSPERFYERAGIWAEFGKIICISVGFLHRNEGRTEFRLRSFFDHEERVLLKEFRDLLENHFNSTKHALCAHNGKEFDFPYLARRMLINGIRIPELLRLQGKKPWEVRHIDTMDLWKFGDYKHHCSLPLLCHVFDIPSPKDAMNGSDVGSVYYEEGNLIRIVDYCEADTIAVARLYLKLMGEDYFDDKAIIQCSVKEMEQEKQK